MLVIDTATAACSVALLEEDRVIAQRHDAVGRGHAERLLPMIAALPAGGRADLVLVDCGPGSFTGIRVGIAAARGLALGWNVEARGFSSTALLAAAALAERPGERVAIILEGGHGEVFVQGFAADLTPEPLVSAPPAAALGRLDGHRVVGNAQRRLHALDAALEVDERLPDAAAVVHLPPGFRDLPPVPIYGRAPDALPMAR